MKVGEAMTLREQFGDIDIYLFDQVLRERIRPGMSILDAGCGGGRNLAYFLRSGYEVHGIDASREAIAAVRSLAGRWVPGLAAEHFRVEPVEAMSFADQSFDAVISSAVLHFARDEAQFHAMLREMWRVLRPAGFFFARLASSIGIETRIRPLGNRRYRLPDGSDRFLVDEEMLLALTAELGGSLADPIKTTNVQNLRCMTTWCLVKT
ncbi:MAG: class I SAM-dependent methyltransferase [Thermoanaerobaculia bacterium]